MLEYLYMFVTAKETYYVYAPSEKEATRIYLKEHNLEALPKDAKISRSND